MTDKNTLNLARQWVEDINACPWALSPRTAAAADIIESLPDEWVGTNELWQYIHDWRERFSTAPRGHYETEMLNELEALMTTPATPPTLADMSPEERAECQWMQCDIPELEEPGIILSISEKCWCDVVSREGVVETEALSDVTPRPDLPRMQWPGNEPGDDGQEFDPAYAYRDGYGVKWARVSGVWLREGYLLGFPYSAPPARYGPYTRIEKEETSE